MSEHSSDGAPAFVSQAPFLTTQWSVVLAAGQAALPALEKLCRTYWRPVYGFVRRQGCSVEDAQDITQGFFARLLERDDLKNVGPGKGRFRSYLLVAVKNFLINERNRERAEKRGGGQPLLSLEELRTEEMARFEPVDSATAAKLFERRWAWAVLEEVLERLKAEFGGNPRLFESWKANITGESEPLSQAEIAAEFGMSENAVKQGFHRLRERYRHLLREEVANTVSTPPEIEDELRYLISVLRN